MTHEKTSTAIAALFLALIVAVAAHYALLRIPNYFEKKARLLETARRCEIVILGSSHAMFAVRPKSLTTTATNLANVSQSLEIDEKILAKLFRQPTKTKLVVVPVSYFSYAYNLRSNPETEYRDPLYSIYMGVRERNDFESLRDPRYWNLVAFYSAFNHPFPLLNARSVFDDPQIDEQGWAAGRVGIDSISNAIGKQRVDAHHLLMHNHLKKRNRRAIEHMIALARERGAKVLLLVTPVTREYSRAVRRNFLAGELKFLSSLVTNSVASDVRLANYHDDVRFSTRDFVDCDHLNQLGATRFTEILDEEFIAPMLSKGTEPAKM